jgi:uncharacterized protein
MQDPFVQAGGAGEGFEVTKYGDGRVALIGFPSVGKSTLLSHLTGTESEVAAYEFTTLTCIPGVIHYKGTKIQLLDLPGIIEGAASGKGRGRQVRYKHHRMQEVTCCQCWRGSLRDGWVCQQKSGLENPTTWQIYECVQVIAVCKSADLLLMVLDAVKPISHREILTRELHAVGIRLNREAPKIHMKKKKTGGIGFNSTVPLTHMDEKMVFRVMQEYKIHNADILFKEDATVDDFIDVLEVLHHCSELLTIQCQLRTTRTTVIVHPWQLRDTCNLVAGEPPVHQVLVRIQ